ncbi:unnamed protein product [Fraxinus pennsylvanica]|uniref:SAM domain-containing protein n=1 Tax=Fraxinus pennsylvanica TaxID=56036 RepID=A0AAD2E437_9LAMI|nr:unnamed protein product [Fraxinus pennsylvanica]
MEEQTENNQPTTSESQSSEVESLSTMGFGELDNSSFQLTMEKLNGKNYHEWAQLIKLIVDGKGKLGYLTGEKKQPASTDAVFLQRWRSENSLVNDHLTVESFLQSLGLEKYAIYFKAEEVDMYSLKQMGDSDLKALGIPMGPRKKILLSLLPRSSKRPA